jgi:hypothetical protein
MSEQEPSFESQVSTAAAEAGIKDTPAEAPAPEQLELEPTTTPEGSPDEPAVPPPAPKVEEPLKDTIPLAVHIKAREQHQRELREMRQQFEIGNQRLQELTQRFQPPQPPPPDPETDPLGAALNKLDHLEQSVNQVVAKTQEEQKTAYLRQQISQFERAVYEDEQQYKAEVPDLNEAMQYAKDTKFREYVALGMDAHQAAARVQQDAFALANHAFQNGLSPSDLVYRMAGALGYKKGVNGTNGAAHAPVAETSETPETPHRLRDEYGRFVDEAPQKPSAERTIEMRAAGAERSKGGGGSPENLGPITLQQLATMDNEEFAKMTSGKKWNKLMGG